jgi:hypothetical protein
MEDWLLILLISLDMMFEAVIVAYLSGRWAYKIFIRGFTEQTPATKAAVAGLISVAMITPVATGKSVKDENGRDIPETKPLFVYMGRQLFYQFELYLRSKAGGMNSGLEKMASSDPEMAALMQGGGMLSGIRKRRRDESVISYLIEVAATSPQGQEVIGNIMKTKAAELLKPPV